MDGNEEDGVYSDLDLDALPENALSELEFRAVQSTQQNNQLMTDGQSQHDQQSLPLLPKPPERMFPVQPRYDGRKAQQYAQSVDYPQQPSSDYGNLDDTDIGADLLDAGDFTNLADESPRGLVDRSFGGPTQRQNWTEQQYGAPLGRQPAVLGIEPPRRPVVASEKTWRRADDDEDMLDDHVVQGQPVPASGAEEQGSDVVDALQVQIQELLRERADLQQAVQTANSNAVARAGEISIVRANHAKTAMEYERRLKVAEKMYADEAARQKTQIQSAKADLQNVTTENIFLKKDLDDEGEQSRMLRRNLKNVGGGGKTVLAKTTANANPVTTPKKHKPLPFRDGFDDDEIMVVSPSKAAPKTKRGTPKIGDKRKRKVVEDSPGQPLLLSQSKGKDTVPNGQEPSPQHEDAALQSLGREDDRFPFVQSVFNHRLRPGHDRTFEAFTKLAFPSAPGRPFSSMLLDGLALLSVKRDAANFTAMFTQMILSIWSQCVDEKYYPPLEILLDLVKFILVQDVSGAAAPLANALVPLAQITADINAIPRFKRFKREPPTELQAGVDVEECLNILYLVACTCKRRDEDIKRFWRLMRWDFVFIMLKASQPLEHIEIMLDILGTSILRDTFGPLIAGNQDQQTNEKHIIERLTALLLEEPIVSEGEELYDAADIAEIRLDVLGVLDAMCETRHGAEALGKHDMAIGRLIRVISDQLNHLYDYHFEHPLRALIINQTTRLLHYLLIIFPSINIQTKLAVIPGGVHKHLVALTRLAFSEGLFLEAGIEDDVVDCAHRLLENAITPEEGEALASAFS